MIVRYLTYVQAFHILFILESSHSIRLLLFSQSGPLMSLS